MDNDEACEIIRGEHCMLVHTVDTAAQSASLGIRAHVLAVGSGNCRALNRNGVLAFCICPSA